MTKLLLALAAIACATPALAQWNGYSYQQGQYRYYNGNDGSSGYSYRQGPYTYYQDTTPNRPGVQWPSTCITSPWPGGQTCP